MLSLMSRNNASPYIHIYGMNVQLENLSNNILKYIQYFSNVAKLVTRIKDMKKLRATFNKNRNANI